jgi:hypothetical protein
VFVDTLGQLTEHRQESELKGEMISQLTAELAEVTRYEAEVNSNLRAHIEELAALKMDASTDEENEDKVVAVLTTIQLQLADNAAWQGRVLRLGTEISRLQDDIASLRMAEADLVFSNHALKSELCGRIQQLQLMSKGTVTFFVDSMFFYLRSAHQLPPFYWIEANIRLIR